MKMTLKAAKQKVKANMERNRLYQTPGVDYASNAFERCRLQLTLNDLIQFQKWYTNLKINPNK